MKIVYTFLLYVIAFVFLLGCNKEGQTRGLENKNISYNNLIIALKNENHLKIKSLVTNKGSSLDFDQNGPEYFRWALRCKSKFCIQTLLKNGLDPNTFDDDDNRNMIFSSLGEQRIEHLDTLLLFGVDINVTDTNGQTPLIYAIVIGQYKTAIKLIENGANLKLRDRFGDDALAVFLETIPTDDTYHDKYFYKLKILLGTQG